MTTSLKATRTILSLSKHIPSLLRPGVVVCQQTSTRPWVWTMSLAGSRLHSGPTPFPSATSTLRAYSFSERNVYNTPYAVIDRLAEPMYKVEGSKIKLIPENSASGTITLLYVPLAPEYPNADLSGNQVEFIIPGFVEYVVVATAIRMLMKEESDVSALERERQQLASRIIRAITPRDASGSHAIRDVRKGRYRDDFILRY